MLLYYGGFLLLLVGTWMWVAITVDYVPPLPQVQRFTVIFASRKCEVQAYNRRSSQPIQERTEHACENSNSYCGNQHEWITSPQRKLPETPLDVNLNLSITTSDGPVNYVTPLTWYSLFCSMSLQYWNLT